MRTTLKRGVGRGANGNGNGRAVFPPGPVSSVTRYRQPPPPARTGIGLVGRILLITFIVLTSLILGIAGGSYLYFHQSVSAVQAHSTDVKKAQKALDIPVAHEAVNALIIGYDHRAGTAASDPSLSDTLMLVRADPSGKTVSLLSFPRDLDVPIYCPARTGDSVGTVVATDRINSAYSRCGSTGTVETMKHLTGLPINYLITVNFHGFKEVVDKLGGVWMDVDRRYYNKNTGASYDNYSNINLQPGYQLLDGGAALEFVRFRHTDSDLYRVARQQEFVKSLREQIHSKFSPLKIPGIVNAITSNVDVGEGGRKIQGKDVLNYAFFAYGLPNGHFFQDRISDVACPPAGACTVPQSAVDAAVQQFTNPDVGSSKAANAAALGQKVKQKAPPPSSVTVTVLNGSGVAGAAANTSYLLGQRGYKTLIPPNNLDANTPPGKTYFHSVIYYDPAQKRSKAAAVALQSLMQPAEVSKLPLDPSLRALDPGSMLVVALGTAFGGTLPPAPVVTVPKHTPAYVRYDASVGQGLLEPFVRKAHFKLMVPTVLEASSEPDTLPGDVPSRIYWIDHQGGHKAIRLIFHTGSDTEFWGIEETNWTAAPILADRSFRHDLGGREFELYYNGSHLHMVVLNANGASYWVVNTLLDSLSNETMLAIAKGLKPLTSRK